MELRRLDESAPRPPVPKTDDTKSRIPQVPKGWNLRQLIGLSAPKHEPSSLALSGPAASSKNESVQATTLPVINSTPPLQFPTTHGSPECNADAASEHTIRGGRTISRTSIEDSECRTATPGQSTALSTPSASVSIDNSQLDQVIKIDKGIFASPKHKMDECHLQAWNIIRSRLGDTLRHTFKPIPGLDATMSLEFMMAGPSPSQLQPSIIMVCCSEPHKRQLNKILKAQKWIASYNYHCIVLVDPLQQTRGWGQRLCQCGHDTLAC